MAFRIVPSPTFRVKVPLTVPGAAAAGVVEVEFKHKGREAYGAWWDSIGSRGDAEVLDEVITGWTDVIDDKGEPVPYGLEALALLLDRFPASGIELLAAYKKALWEAREKN
ncbi:MAG: phage tail assembly chaperone [Gammaproteobacteria bacterium]|nr:phage tail assembly chaperone [Gammaproteobacteria bacterium]MBU1647422.1 phage tail assembly chaperone [Gammaproteobacteria bacterium]MBU1973214.1 phage tail assembly chaperone [Gammaproteobacteria bacterium]